jgi:hypothetical protein
MPTRIYTRSSGTPAVTPSSWEFTDQINPVSVPATLTQNTGDAMIVKQEATGTTNPTFRAMGRSILGPLAAQTISGTVKGQIRGREFSLAANASPALAIKLIQPDGTNRGVLLAQTASDAATAGNEFASSNMNIPFRDVNESASITLSSQTASAGDYLVIEWGFRSATSTSANINMIYGNDSATDLGENATDTDPLNPWWEFSGTITLEAPVATRIYTASSGTPGVTPSTWAFTDQINPVTLPGTTTRNTGSAMTSKTEATGTINPTFRAMGRTVWGPLAAQTISGTVSGQMRGLQSHSSANTTPALAIKLVQPTGADRGVLLAQTASDNPNAGWEFIDTTLMNRAFRDSIESATLTLTSQTAQAGDYLVIEWGFRSATTTDRTITLSYGNDSATDLPVNETTTAPNNPWWEFSATITLQPSGLSGTVDQAGMAATSQPVTYDRTRLVMQDTSPETSQALAPERTYPVVQTSSTNTSEALTRDRSRLVQQPTSPESAQVLLAPAVLVLPAAVQTDTSQGLSPLKSAAVGQTHDSETSQGLSSQAPWTGRLDFTSALSVSIPGTLHGLGTAALLVQVYDDGDPASCLRAAMAVHPTTYDVTVSFLQLQSGYVLVSAAAVTYGQSFSGLLSVTMPGTAHGFGTPNLLVTVYGASTPAQEIAADITVNQSTYDVTATFLQAQSGRLVVAQVDAPGPPFNQTTSLTNVLSVTVPGTTHGLGTVDVLAQIYDAQIPAQALAAQLSVHPGTYDVTATFLQPQSGTLILNAAALSATIPVGQVVSTETSQSVTLPPPWTGRLDFSSALTVSIPGTLHALGTADLLIQVYDSGTPATRLRPAIAVHDTTYDVTVTFTQAQSGYVLVSRAVVTYGQSFSSLTTVTVPGTAHGFGTANLLVTVYDAGSPAQELLVPVTVDQSTYAVTATFLQAQSGTLVIGDATAPGPPVNSSVTFSAQTSVTLPGSTHGLGSAALLAQVYDAATPAHQVLAPLSIHPTTFDVTATFLQPQSGRLVLNAAVVSVATPVAQVTEPQTAQALSVPRIRLVLPTLMTATSQPVSVQVAGLLSQVSSTETSQSLTREKRVFLSIVTLPETAQATQALHGAVVGTSQATDTSQVLPAEKTHAVGAVFLTETAQAVSLQVAGVLSQGLSQETSQAVTRSKSVVVTAAPSTETPQALTAAKARALAVVMLTETAQLLLVPPTRLLAVSQEIATAQDMSVPANTLITQVLGTETGQAMAWSPRTRLLTAAATTESAQTLLAPLTRLLLPPSSSDVSQPITWSPLVRLVGSPLETATGQAVIVPGGRLVSQAPESASSLPVQWAPQIRLLPLVQTLNTALLVSSNPLARLVVPSTTPETGQAIQWRPKERLVSQSLMPETSQGLTVPGGRLVTAPQETATAPAVTRNPQIRLLSPALTSESSQAVPWSPLTRLMLPVWASETSQTVLVPGGRLVAIAATLNIAQTILWSPKIRILAQTFETASSQAVRWSPQARLVGATVQAESSQGVTWLLRRFAGQSVEQGSGIGLIRPAAALVLPTATAEQAVSIIWSPVMRLVPVSLELATAWGMASAKVQLYTGTEEQSEATLARWVPVTRLVRTSEEQALAWPLGGGKLDVLSQAVVSEESGTITTVRVLQYVGVSTAEQAVVLTWAPRTRLVGLVVSTETAPALPVRAGIRYAAVFGTWSLEPRLSGQWSGRLEAVVQGTWTTEPVLDGAWSVASVETLLVEV